MYHNSFAHVILRHAFWRLKKMSKPSCSICFKIGYVRHSISFIINLSPWMSDLNSHMSSIPNMTRTAGSNLPHLYFSGSLPRKVSIVILRLFREAPAFKHSRKTPFFRSISIPTDVFICCVSCRVFNGNSVGWIIILNRVGVSDSLYLVTLNRVSISSRYFVSSGNISSNI